MSKVKTINCDEGSAEDPVARDAAEVEDALKSMGLEGELGQARRIALQSFRDNFTSSATPEGQTWPERKNEGDGHPLLMDTGALVQAVTGGGAGHISRIGERELELGVDMGVDQGGIPAAAALDGGTSTMPSRHFHGIKPVHLDQIDAILADGILERL